MLHGRDDERSYSICPAAADLPDRDGSHGLKAVEAGIGRTLRDGKECIDVRYDFLSVFVSAAQPRNGGA